MSGQPGNLAPGQPHELSVDSCAAPLCELEKAILRGMGSVPNRTSYELQLPADLSAFRCDDRVVKTPGAELPSSRPEPCRKWSCRRPV